MHRDRGRELSRQPLAYFITFRCYGTWLPGDERGWVDRRQNGYGTDIGLHSSGLQSTARSALTHPPFRLDSEERAIVDGTIRDVCAYRRWVLHALNVRTNHVHMVVSAASDPESVMTTLKGWSTRRLREAGLIDASRRAWSRHGSTRYLWKEDQVELACGYVMDGQGADLR
jgi:REP element-mobilizing transposase RayT